MFFLFFILQIEFLFKEFYEVSPFEYQMLSAINGINDFEFRRKVQIVVREHGRSILVE